MSHRSKLKKVADPIDKHVGSRVRMRRMMLAMSQEKLGAAIGLTFQQVQKYEKGKNRIGASRLQQISGILQVPVSFFFEGSPGISPGSSARDGAVGTATAFFSLPGARSLAEHYTSLGADTAARAAVVHMARVLSERPQKSAQQKAA